MCAKICSICCSKASGACVTSTLRDGAWGCDLAPDDSIRIDTISISSRRFFASKFNFRRDVHHWFLKKSTSGARSLHILGPGTARCDIFGAYARAPCGHACYVSITEKGSLGTAERATCAIHDQCLSNCSHCLLTLLFMKWSVCQVPPGCRRQTSSSGTV